MDQPTITNPPNPYVGTLRLFPGTLVKVSGRPRPNATRFAINFQNGPSLNPRDDLALHLSPCFTPPRIVRNSLRSGAWGLEEAWGNGAILNPHSSFEIMILVEHEQFKIAINGAHYCEFKHRFAFQEVTHLTIDGDVDVERITITSAEYTTPQMYNSPSAPPTNTTHAPPYPTGPSAAMPMPPMYPTLSSGMPSQTGSYPAAVGAYASANMPAGPMPTAASYASGYPGAQAPAYPGHHVPTYPTMSGAGPHNPMGGPMPTGAGYQGGPAPTGAGYQGGYPQQPYHQNQAPQPGHSSSSPFGSLPIGGKALGTLAGLGLGAAAGAAVLSAANPLKHVKKIMKPKKMFKHKGWGGRSSSSSNSSISSRSSFSSNSS